MQKCHGGEGEGHTHCSGKEGGRRKGPFTCQCYYVYTLICRVNLAQMGMCRCTDCGFVANWLLTISLFSAFNMVGSKGHCSCPQQFLGASFRKEAGSSTLELFSV